MCRLPALNNVMQALLLANPDEHESGRPLVAALRRLPSDSVESTDFVLFTAPEEVLPCSLRERLGLLACRKSQFWRSKQGVALMATAGALLVLCTCCILLKMCTACRRCSDARGTKLRTPHAPADTAATGAAGAMFGAQLPDRPRSAALSENGASGSGAARQSLNRLRGTRQPALDSPTTRVTVVSSPRAGAVLSLGAAFGSPDQFGKVQQYHEHSSPESSGADTRQTHSEGGVSSSSGELQANADLSGSKTAAVSDVQDVTDRLAQLQSVLNSTNSTPTHVQTSSSAANGRAQPSTHARQRPPSPHVQQATLQRAASAQRLPVSPWHRHGSGNHALYSAHSQPLQPQARTPHSQAGMFSNTFLPPSPALRHPGVDLQHRTNASSVSNAICTQPRQQPQPPQQQGYRYLRPCPAARRSLAYATTARPDGR